MNTNNNYRTIRWLTYLMFLMFAMTTDAVGVIIPELMKQFDLGLTKAGLVHYAPMAAIAVAGLVFGFLADLLGRKKTIVIGLGIFAAVSFCFALGSTFYYFLSLMVLSGLAVGIFKTAALALIADISQSTREHTSTVNGIEAFFAVGAIIGPAIVTYLLSQGMAWHWLYVVAGVLCLLLILLASASEYPQVKNDTQEKVNFTRTLSLLKNPYAFGFSAGAFCYVATETAIYVWMPTYLLGYEGPAVSLAAYALTIFFILRAVGRFIGMWLINRCDWAALIAVCSGLIVICFLLSVLYGKALAVYLLPLSGLFMSVIYPTLNSKGISCFEKNKHGTVAGVILFFTALGAAAGPLIMGLVADANGGDVIYGFIVATVFASLLFFGLLFNWVFSPVKNQLSHIEETEYHVSGHSATH